MTNVTDPPATLTADPRVRSTTHRDTTFALLRSGTLLVGVAIVGFWVVCAFAGETIAPHDPLFQYDEFLVGPQCHFHALSGLRCGEHWFGTDQLGRDVASRVFVGASDTLQIAPLAALLGSLGGTALGLTTGYFGGAYDEIVGRITDAVLALPLIVTAVVALVALGSSKGTLILLIGAVFTPLVGRTVRAAVLAERELDYVEAARLRGERAPYIMFAEILPNVMGPIIVETTVRLAYAIFAVAGLTFLGFGVQPPSPDWSLQIAENYTLLPAGTYYWTVLFPAGAIATLIVGVNLIADGLQQVLDR